MCHRTIVTWAVPVNTEILGARLEAYVSSKAAIRTFRLCVQYAQTGRALRQLPAEMIESVARFIQQSQFDDRIGEWEAAHNCCKLFCSPVDHLSPSEYEKMRDEIYDETGCSPDCDCPEGFGNMMEERDSYSLIHEVRVSQLLRKIGTTPPSKPIGYTPFNICRKAFADDFSLEVYFDIFSDWANHEYTWKSPKTTIFAYIILPTTMSKPSTSFGPLTVSTISSVILDPSLLRGLAMEQKALFQVALRTLRLAPTANEMHIQKFCPTSSLFLSSKQETLTTKPLTRAVTDQTPKEIDALPPTEWPKLMMLGSGDYEAEPDNN